MITESFNHITEYRLEAVTDSPLHVGSGERDLCEVLVHPLTDLPFLQASGIAGALRNVSVNVNGSDTTERLFGFSHIGKNDTVEECGSRVRITDGIFNEELLPMEFRPRVSIDSFSGAVASENIAGSEQSSGHKFEIEMIGSGAELSFRVYLYHRKDDGLQNALEKVLAEVKEQNIQFGGQKSNGGGFIRLTGLYRKTFNMEKAADRKEWIDEGDEDPDQAVKNASAGSSWGDDILNSLPDTGSGVFSYQIRFRAKTEGSLLVKGIEVDKTGGNTAVDLNIKNCEGAYIIPGSSLKGALRSRAEILTALLDKKPLLTCVFGNSGKKKNSGIKGQVVIRDVIVGKAGEQIGYADEVREVVQNRIHIDKFTGGVMDGALFAQKVISGPLDIRIAISKGENAAASAGLILLVLRDLAAGAFNLGGGFSIGRGFVDADSLEISAVDKGGAEPSVIDFKSSNISDKSKVIQQCLNAVAEWKEM